MEIRTPIIAILVLTILVVIYLRKNIPQVFSTRVFFGFLITAYLCTVSEFVECAVFTQLDSSFRVLRRTTQGFYVGTLILCVFMMALYAYAKANHGRMISKLMIALMTTPGIIAVIAVIVGEIYYTRSASGQYYSYGPAIVVCYIVGFYYIITTLVYTIARRKRLHKEEFRAIVIGLLMWFVLTLFQFLFHGYQVSAVGIMLMALILFIAMENPKEFYEKNMLNVRNKEAFTLTLVEKFGFKQNFFIASVIFTGRTSVLSGEERQHLIVLQTIVAEKASLDLGIDAYLSDWNALSFVIKDPEKVEALMSMIANFKDNTNNYKLTYSILEVPKCSEDVDEALQILSYVAGEYVYTQSAPNLVINKTIVDKMVYRNSVEDVVRQAVIDKAFDVYYQPILSVKEGRFTSTEALVRLRQPKSENYISPEDFIPIAEKCGLIKDIDDLVFEKVCSFIARENLSSYGVKTVEVNLSGHEVVDKQTYARLLGKMEKYHIPPKFINFEITETAYINNDDTFKENVQKLKDMGSTFSMDDFGSGYSNLLELLKMDYKLVKMDKEFVWNCLDKTKPENQRMLEYSISFLKDYGLHILAEGVETVEQAEILVEKGVEYLQGFYYSRPIPENEYIEFLKAQKGERQ